MSYLYENTNAERFQHLCQSLLIRSFPGLQCYPVGQPDGGRDGWDPDSKTVLQVKFKKVAVEDTADWMIAALEKEKPKIERLAQRGATKYLMMTNAHGTAHLATGKIDRVQNWMDVNLPIPAQCFWRDEIDRRLDQAPPELKLKYSELITLEDGIDLLVGDILGSNSIQRSTTLRAFVASQFNLDRKVKFKQVSLSNDLLDLFIDVPVGISNKFLRKQSWTLDADFSSELGDALATNGYTSTIDQSFGNIESLIYSNQEEFSDEPIGAAQFLLSSGVQDHLKLVVLEGAPGQGKSTLAQFVCQMHRARFLNRTEVLRQVDENYAKSTFRMPIKIDLRDFATFLGDYSSIDDRKSNAETRSLEMFVAGLISKESGGLEFKTHDWMDTVQKLPILLFFDGLDEVADVRIRHQLISTIGSALERWKEFNADVQVVVTSRPSLFGTSPSFEKLGFTTLQLSNIEMYQISTYSTKWAVANHLDQIEKDDLTKILIEKLQLTHIRDLTRNPMQLTILLSLIHQVGHSLPDQRTDLYRRYLDLFLTREADKSIDVREHQAILLGFIQHLAWELQREAEASKAAGSISAEGLKEMARGYLKMGGHDVKIAEDLFGGGLERIFVLVERIEGLYEFEVQPLREYFCAQHLYSTAPVGTYLQKDNLRGDRAQRFEALASNPFWLNVCRFYAGSCERSERAMLVYSLKEMISDRNLAVSIHARRVGLSLLQDWVFSNTKRPQEDLIRAIFDKIGFRYLTLPPSDPAALSLPVDCGQDVLRNCAFELINKTPSDLNASAICFVLRNNGGSKLATEFEEILQGLNCNERTLQLKNFFKAGAAQELSPSRIWSLITEDNPNRKDLRLRTTDFFTSDANIAEKSPDAVKFFVELILNGEVVSRGYANSPIGRFAAISNFPTAFIHVVRSSKNSSENKPEQISELTKVSTCLNTISSRIRGVGGSWIALSNDYQIPQIQADAIREVFGENWASHSLAILAAGMKTSDRPSKESKNLFDKSISLYERARSARLHRGGPRWWSEQLSKAESELDKRLWAGLVLSWSSVQNLMSLSVQLNEIVDSLDEYEYHTFKKTISRIGELLELRADRKRINQVDLTPFSDRCAVLVAIAFQVEENRLLTLPHQRKATRLETYIKESKQLEALSKFPKEKDSEEYLSWNKEIQALIVSDRQIPYSIIKRIEKTKCTAIIAAKVTEDYDSFPLGLLTIAGGYIERNYRPQTLAKCSMNQDWAFE